ncbi:MAG: 50S ribosomal protein L9 [Coriobacteriales bacterium]|nr:50S ribosomal protein L9 [Coriobacteriales bacterium]
MKVILLGELRGKGGEGDVVDVAQGFAENYLYPNRIAMPATAGNLKQLEERRHNIAKREEQRLADAAALKETLEGKAVKVEARVGEEGQLFGSVTSANIADAIKAQLGVEIDRKRVARSHAIKMAGRHEVEINLYRDINATVAVLVGIDEEPEVEAEAEAEVETEDAPEAEAAAEE